MHKRTFFKDKIKSGANRTANLTFIKIRTQTQAHTDPAKGPDLQPDLQPAAMQDPDTDARF